MRLTRVQYRHLSGADQGHSRQMVIGRASLTPNRDKVEGCELRLAAL